MPRRCNEFLTVYTNMYQFIGLIHKCLHNGFERFFAGLRIFRPNHIAGFYSFDCPVSSHGKNRCSRNKALAW